jgi:cytochrome c peroxidase
MATLRWAAVRLGRTGLMLAAAVCSSAHAAAPDVLSEFDAAARATIVSHGPWPPPPQRDPTNRVSGQPAAIALGKRLFFDPRLSGNGRMACAHCHVGERAFTDGKPRAHGIEALDRNTPALHDLAGQRWFGWDGGADSLWAASVRPILAPAEMGGSAEGVARLIATDRGMRAHYRAVFGPAGDDARVLADVGKALAAYLETLRTPRTAFDRFRDAVAAGDRVAAARYPVAARRGLALFVGEGRCSVCHAGPRFSNGEFHDVGIAFMPAPGRVDPGRHAGIRRLLTDPYSLLGPYNDQTAPTNPAGDTARAVTTRTVTLQPRNWGEWKTPGLRGLARTAPYMHDGSKATLRAVIEHYSDLNIDRLHADGEALLRPLRLSPAQIDDLLAFLATLDVSPPHPERQTAAPDRQAQVAATGSFASHTRLRPSAFARYSAASAR